MNHTNLMKRSQRVLEAAGFRVTPAKGTLGEWDLIGMNQAGVVLVRIAHEDWPDERVRESLQDCPAPIQAARLVHRWRAGARWPDVKVLL